MRSLFVGRQCEYANGNGIELVAVAIAGSPTKTFGEEEAQSPYSDRRVYFDGKAGDQLRVTQLGSGVYHGESRDVLIRWYVTDSMAFDFEERLASQRWHGFEWR